MICFCQRRIRIGQRGNIKQSPDGKTIHISPEQEAEAYLKTAEQILQFHSDHPNAGIIYARTSLAYMVLHRWQDAFVAAKRSLALPWAEWVYASYLPQIEKEKSVLREAKNELLKRALAKDKDK